MFAAVGTGADPMLLQLQNENAQLRQSVHERRTTLKKHQCVPSLVFGIGYIRGHLNRYVLTNRYTGLPKFEVSVVAAACYKIVNCNRET